MKEQRRTSAIARMTVFAALHATLDLIPSPFRNLGMFLEPFEGIILGPWLGAVTALIGGAISRLIIGMSPVEAIFGLAAEPTGACVAGLLSKGNWVLPSSLFAITLTAYFLHPYSMRLPVWPLLDVFVAFLLIYPTARLWRNRDQSDADRINSSLKIALLFFVATVSDSLMRVFLLIPLGLYSVFTTDFQVLHTIFIGGALYSYIEDLLVVLASLLIGVPVLSFIEKDEHQR